MRDLIDRQAAIEAIDAVFPVDPTMSEYVRGITCGAALAKTYIKQLPSAQPERPKGKWVEKPHVYGVAYCSLCDYELHTNDTNFCPHCGADMRGDRNG